MGAGCAAEGADGSEGPAAAGPVTYELFVCSCPFNTASGLYCTHIFAVMARAQRAMFAKDAVPVQWRREYRGPSTAGMLLSTRSPDVVPRTQEEQRSDALADLIVSARTLLHTIPKLAPKLSLERIREIHSHLVCDLRNAERDVEDAERGSGQARTARLGGSVSKQRLTAGAHGRSLEGAGVGRSRLDAAKKRAARRRTERDEAAAANPSPPPAEQHDAAAAAAVPTAAAASAPAAARGRKRRASPSASMAKTKKVSEAPSHSLTTELTEAAASGVGADRAAASRIVANAMGMFCLSAPLYVSCLC